ncbi:MAG: endonuclease III [Chloroflexi bacterium]|nr:endonuclease III [Chloroflexota bacterium]MCL5109069.1 endonuclease III [Chloroflexota bacterium]
MERLDDVTLERKRQYVLRIYELLLETYGPPSRRSQADPVGELVGVILSQHTSDVNTDRAFANLLATFGSMEAVRDASQEAIAAAIKSAGLSNVKAPRIKAVLQTIQARYGSLDLSRLASLPLEEAKSELRSLPGVGPKTAACALLFGLGMPAFPVDTHIHRVTLRLGLLPAGMSAEQAHDYLEPLVPPALVFNFHVLLIWHGRTICQAQRPKCPRCPLLLECVYGRRALGIT